MCKVERRVAMISAMLMLISTNALAVETANPPALQEIENYALKYMRHRHRIPKPFQWIAFNHLEI